MSKPGSHCTTPLWGSESPGYIDNDDLKSLVHINGDSESGTKSESSPGYIVHINGDVESGTKPESDQYCNATEDIYS